MRLPVLLGVAAIGAAQAQAAPAVTVLHAQGVQVYVCSQADAAYAWRLKAPDAVLMDAAGHRVGHHFAGPTWQAEDGSAVVGDALVASPSPKAGAIPWLVLRARSHAGTGLFASTAYVVRSDTDGGAAPATGCDASHADAETRVDYTATYSFFPG